MKAVAALLPLAAQAFPSWAEWKQENAKVYNGDEDTLREQIYNENVNYITDQNALGLSYSLDVNQFADLTTEEFKAQYMNRKAANTDATSLGLHEWQGEELASSVDWSSKGAVTPVKDQGQCGGCWAFAATGGLEGASFIAGNGLTSLAEQQFLDCDKTNDGCGGGLEYDGWNALKSHGFCTEASYAYKAKNSQCQESSCTFGIPANSVTGVTHVQKSKSSLRSAINQQPVSVGVDAEPWQFYSSGIFSSSCGTQLDHSVLAVGYSEGSYWKIKNSWGKSWGESGYIRLTDGNADQCGILDDASYPTVKSFATVEV